MLAFLLGLIGVLPGIELNHLVDLADDRHFMDLRQTQVLALMVFLSTST
jgi:hypothetical protein